MEGNQAGGSKPSTEKWVQSLLDGALVDTFSLPTAGTLLFTSGQPHFPTNIRAHAESQEAFLSPVTDIDPLHTGCKGKAIANPGGRRQAGAGLELRDERHGHQIHEGFF